MTKPDSLPVEDARKKFADILDGTQHHSQHVEITRRGKRAGVVVPPEWYDRAIEALAASSEASPRPGAPRLAPAPEPRAARREPKPAVPMSEQRAERLAALARERATDVQVQMLDQRTGHVSESARPFAVVAEALGMRLLTQTEIDADPEEQP